MTSRDFCFWLQGYFELHGQRTDPAPMTNEQVECVKRHLALVFKHEIDPAIEASSSATKAELDETHLNPSPSGGLGGGLDGGLIRC